LIAPFIFNFLKEESIRKAKKWRTGTNFDISVRRRYWSHREKKLYVNEKVIAARKGLRFSFSKRDLHFLRDMYWAELRLNTQFRKEFQGAAGFIDKRLKRYRPYNDGCWYGTIPFEKLKGAQDVAGAL